MLLPTNLILFAFLTILSVIPCRSQSDYPYISPVIKLELKEALKDAWKLDDVATLHYATSSYRILKEKIPVPEKDVCSFIKKVLSETDSLESLYHVTGIAKDIPACASSQLLSDAGKKVLSSTEKENIGIESLFYVASSLQSISPNITDTAFISKSLKSAVKSNESLLNTAYSFHIGSILPKRDVETLYDQIDSVLQQVYEVDSKFYQFEGGLTVTALTVEGIYKLSESLSKAPPLNSAQLTKFFNYFVSRLTVSRPRGVFALLQVLSKLADNSFHIYVTVGIFDEYLITKESPAIRVRVSNVFGEPLFRDPTPLTVTLSSGKRADGTSIGSKKTLTAEADKVTYTVSATDFSLTPDHYTFLTSVTNPNEKAAKKVIVNPDQHEVKFKVTYRVKIENFQVGVLDSEQSSTADLNKLEYPNKLKNDLTIDSQQRLVIKFTLKDIDFGKFHKVQQAFVQLVNKKSGTEATYVCLSDSNRNYKLSIDPSYTGNAAEFVIGDYELVLVIGDVLLAESIKWPLATIKLKYGLEQPAAKSDDIVYYYKPKPEIKHLFKEPERRPPAVVSNIFSGFVVAPLLILFILWLKLGINVKNFPFTLSAIGFHAGLGSIFILFGIFWLQLNMFQTIKYLLMLGTVTFLSGNKMLCSIASKSKK